MKWLRIPEKIVWQALKEHKEKTGNDFTCVWLQGSESGVYLQDFDKKSKPSSSSSIT